MTPTLFLHVDRQALVEPAGLALVPPDDVHHAPAVVFAEIVQSAENVRLETVLCHPLNSELWTLSSVLCPLNSPCRQPPNAPLEESSAAVTRGNSVVLPTRLIPAHLHRNMQSNRSR